MSSEKLNDLLILLFGFILLTMSYFSTGKTGIAVGRKYGYLIGGILIIIIGVSNLLSS
jgi:hypothetical protein